MKQFALGLIDVRQAISTQSEEIILPSVISGVSGTMRETDLIGWYEGKFILGVIFTEMNGTDPASFVKTLTRKLHDFLSSKLPVEIVEKIAISFHVFPDDWDGQEPEPVDFTLYPDLAVRDDAKRLPRILKRAMDIGGSAAALLLLSPLLFLIAVLIKATSKGPMLFRQERIGQFGKRFQFLKFRSMYHRNDPTIHQDYIRSLISGESGAAQGSGVYKLVNDPRVTPLGRFLRRTSLDELPQFWNVLMGQMSLVGPRPPIPYEALSYDVWHRRRILEAKPGITGLWQVTGRSSTSFNEMVRLDLQYARTWSLGLDLKILLRTPGAVFSGDGAY
jgi:lipopolysaccharide/colanic/teichoic acid biosynthesis glycosyltransferase